MVNDFDFVFRDSHDLSNGSPSWFSAFRDIADTYAFPSPGKVDWAQRELGSVNPILWDIIFSEQACSEKIMSHNIGLTLPNSRCAQSTLPGDGKA